LQYFLIGAISFLSLILTASTTPVHSINCDNIAVTFTFQVVQFLNKCEAGSADLDTNRFFKSMSDLNKKFNAECIDTTDISMISEVEPIDLFFYGFDIHIRQNPDAEHPEYTFEDLCREKIQSVFEVFSNSLKITVKLNFQMLVTDVQDKLIALKKQNSVCNPIFDKVNKHFKPVDPSKCPLLVVSFVKQVNQFLNKCEKNVSGSADFETSDLFMAMTATHKQFNNECIDAYKAFQIEYFEPVSVYYMGLEVHGQIKNSEHPELQYINKCRDRIESLFEEFSGAMKVTVKVSLDMIVNSVRSKQLQFRRENSICNKLNDRVFTHF